ncbi:MAG: mucoidy inhibitor MuiA family protein [Gammaproteobacteria bacterium]
MKSKHWKSFVLTMMLINITTSVTASVITTNHHIDEVTVYPRNAMVTRMANLQLSVGDHIIVLDNLPANIHDKSLRVSGQGSAKVLIGSVERKLISSYNLVQEKEKRLNSKILVLQDEMSMLNNDIESLNLQLAFIKNIGQNIPKSINDEIKVNTINPKIWKEAWTNIGTGASDTYRAILLKTQQQRKILDKLNNLKFQLQQIQTGNRSVSQARININVQQAGKFTVKLSYQINGAMWQAVYDARLNVDNSNIILTQFGQVRQHTGEDWNNVKLTLSTSNPTVGVKMPNLQPWFVNILKPINYREEKMRSDAVSVESFEDSINAEEFSVALMKNKSELDYAQAVVSNFSAEYHISGRSNIIADNASQKFTITKTALSAKLAARVVPEQNAKAYLYAETVYTGLAPLLAGQVSLFRDNSYIGNQRLEQIQPSEKIKLSFGIDDRIKVDYKLITDKHSENGFLTTNNVINRLYHTDITNHHTIPFTIELQQQIPVSQDETITVELSEKTTQPLNEDSDDRPGVLTWKYLYQPNSKKQISLGYQVSYPKDKVIQGL